MIKRNVVAFSLLVTFLAPLGLMAEEPTKTQAAKPVIPSMDDVLNAWGITFSGYLDVAYSHASREPADRVFDTNKNSFNLHQAAVTIAKQPKEGFGALINVIAGEDAKTIASNQPSTNSFDLTQAFIQFATGPLTIIGGKFVTLAGAEVIASPSNNNYTRSILFGSVPFTHTGLRATYVVNDTLSLIGGVNNGWDQVTDNNAQKTLELGASLTPIKDFTIALSDYVGTENATTLTTTQHGTRNLFDVVLTYAVSDALSFGGEFLDVRQDNFPSVSNRALITAEYQGIAGYASLQFGGPWKLSGRVEWFDDKDGARFGSADNKVKEITATLGYTLSKNAELRGEIRADKSDAAIFPDSNGNNGKTLTTVGVQALFKF
jgi:hypothetical protein